MASLLGLRLGRLESACGSGRRTPWSVPICVASKRNRALIRGWQVRFVETVGRTEFVRPGVEDRDPISAMLFYLALRKLHIVNTFWKQAGGHSDQRQMLKFLSNDFEQQRWRTAASKNAFALMSKQRFRESEAGTWATTPTQAQLLTASTVQSLPLLSSCSATASKMPSTSASASSTTFSSRS